MALTALPLPGPAGTAGVLLAASAGAAFLALTVRVLVLGGRARPGAEHRPGGAGRNPALWGAAAGAVPTVPAVIVANSGGDAGAPAAAGGPPGAAAGTVRTVSVTLADTRHRHLHALPAAAVAAPSIHNTQWGDSAVPPDAGRGFGPGPRPRHPAQGPSARRQGLMAHAGAGPRTRTVAVLCRDAGMGPAVPV
ncbi:hypothetical protein ACF1A5_26410 [Streptomyces sp. NPDC014864]|uniref:hypothetical protein n=1 Tax=Streptomyces sp. NPDC014864 TaxID=3364924 RepID=UPI0036F98C32